MALGHGAELADVDGLAQVHFHVPADLVGERYDVLRLLWQVAVDFFINLGRLVHAACKVWFEAGFHDLVGRVVAVSSRIVLPFLAENAVALEVAIASEVSENVKSVIYLLERTPGFVSSVPAPPIGAPSEFGSVGSAACRRRLCASPQEAGAHKDRAWPK